MTVELFTKEHFESVLVENYGFKVGDLGRVSGEYCYFIQHDDAVGVYVRSSVGVSKTSADAGEDSIRVYLARTVKCSACGGSGFTKDRYECMECNGNGVWVEPISAKAQRWVTRVTGWESRLVKAINTQIEWADKAGRCPRCKEPKHIYISKSAANPNRVYAVCSRCKDDKNKPLGFVWITK